MTTNRIAVIGPTGSGKTVLVSALSHYLSGGGVDNAWEVANPSKELDDQIHLFTNGLLTTRTAAKKDKKETILEFIPFRRTTRSHGTQNFLFDCHAGEKFQIHHVDESRISAFVGEYQGVIIVINPAWLLEEDKQLDLVWRTAYTFFKRGVQVKEAVELSFAVWFGADLEKAPSDEVDSTEKSQQAETAIDKASSNKNPGTETGIANLSKQLCLSWDPKNAKVDLTADQSGADPQSDGHDQTGHLQVDIIEFVKKEMQQVSYLARVMPWKQYRLIFEKLRKNDRTAVIALSRRDLWNEVPKYTGMMTYGKEENLVLDENFLRMRLEKLIGLPGTAKIDFQEWTELFDGQKDAPFPRRDHEAVNSQAQRFMQTVYDSSAIVPALPTSSPKPPLPVQPNVVADPDAIYKEHAKRMRRVRFLYPFYFLGIMIVSSLLSGLCCEMGLLDKSSWGFAFVGLALIFLTAWIVSPISPLKLGDK